MGVFLSIIIPAYNAAAYIERCLDSIVNQKVFCNSADLLVEVIVVDDCSIDRTYDIASSYKMNYTHVTVSILRTETNKQQGAARNMGLCHATGKYVWFVDADDYIYSDFLELIYDEDLRGGVDVFQFNAVCEYHDGRQCIEEFLPHAIVGLSGKEYLEYEANINYTNRIKATWSKWYRREFLVQNGLFFKEGVYWEDVVHTLRCIYRAETLLYKPILGYVYLQTIDSDMRGVQDGRKFADSIGFCIDSMVFMKEESVSQAITKLQIRYYEKVLRKYKKDLYKLSYPEYLIFASKIKRMDRTIIGTFCHSKEHNWLNSTYSLFFAWIISKIWRRK